MPQEMSWTGKESSNKQQHKARGPPSCRIVYMFFSGNIKFVLKLNTQQYFLASVSLGMLFYESDKRPEAEVRHSPQYRSPLTGEREKSLPFLTPHSFLPSFHVKDTHQLILKKMTWAPESLDVTESITGDLSNQTMNYAEHNRFFPKEHNFIKSLKTNFVLFFKDLKNVQLSKYS